MASQYESEKVGKFSEQKRLKGMQMVPFECPRHWKSSVSSTFEVGRFLLFHYWPSGVIRNGSPVWRWKRWKIFTKWVQWAANGLVWMPQALKSICVIQFWSWVNLPLLHLLGKKKWLPSIKVKRIGNFLDNIGWLGCKWTSSNAPGMKFHLCDSILKLGDSPIIGYLG